MGSGELIATNVFPTKVHEKAWSWIKRRLKDPEDKLRQDCLTGLLSGESKRVDMDLLERLEKADLERFNEIEMLFEQIDNEERKILEAGK